ncbi:MAG: DUF885 domain-containing protein [Nitrospiraceae bacterium]|nr:MAG: DUF885 domain-containing protein [Nitrospiraceae bacterium]
MGEELQQCLHDYWESVLRSNPAFATYIGDHRYDSLLEDLSMESITAQNGHFRELLDRAVNIEEKGLIAENRLNLRLLKKTLQNHIRSYEYRTYCLPLDHMQGPHLDFPQIVEYHPLRTQADRDNYIARLKAFPDQIGQVIALLQEGITRSITSFGKIIEHVLAQTETLSALPPEKNPLFTAVEKAGTWTSDEEKKGFDEHVRAAISSRVTPAYRKLHEYLGREYMKHCRAREGIWSLPDGEDMYCFFVRYHTTTDRSPDDIHQLGLSEVKRIEGEIEKVMARIGFSGSIRDFARFLKQKRELYPAAGQEILDSYRKILAEMDRRLPAYFGRLPRAAYDIKAIEAYREQAAPAAYYYAPPRDFSRPGYFYANTYMPEERPKYEMEALSYHEAVPGHHLQIAIMQELEGIPEFRRHEGSTAFIEGWALYAEKLSKEMGFYQDDFSDYGRLSFELWRAVRLVVDTGLHFYKWTRGQTIEYCRENTGLEDHEIEVEVDRYIAMPGQALAYKIGELKILELRERARNARGDQFEIREFHDCLLEKGALPLDILERVMEEWMKGGG